MKLCSLNSNVGGNKTESNSSEGVVRLFIELQSAALGQSQGYVKSFIGSWLILLCYRASQKSQEELLKKHSQNLADWLNCAGCSSVSFWAKGCVNLAHQSTYYKLLQHSVTVWVCCYIEAEFLVVDGTRQMRSQIRNQEVNSHGQNIFPRIFPRIFPKKLHIKKLQ